MSASEQLDKASAQLKGLSDRASVAESNASAAKAKNQAQLEQQVHAAEAGAKKTAEDLKASAKDSNDEASEWWVQVQGNWKSHVAKVRKDADAAKANLNADRAEMQAERAEDNADAAVEFAYAALEEAEYQVLNAALARLDADAYAAAV